MNHLPYPDNGHYPPARIPFMIQPNTPRYDGLGLAGFASRCGWQGTRYDWFECQPHVAAERAQSWLYFGLLREVFGQSVREDDFVRTDETGSSSIDTAARLPDLLKTWSGSYTWRVFKFVLKSAMWRLAVLCSAGLILLFVKSPWLERQMRDGRDLHPKFLSALQESEIQVRRLEGYHKDSDHVGSVCLSIRALIWSIRNAGVNRNPDLMKREHLPLSPSPFLESVLLQRGFCPHELFYIRDRCSVAAIHYISAYAYDVVAHQECTTEKCVAFVVDSNSYVTQHVGSCHGCDPARVDLSELKDMIASGETPFVAVYASQHGVHLDVESITTHTSYVAISHAWSGGLGNTSASCLPSCQVERIVNIIRPLFPSQPPSRPTDLIWSLMKCKSQRSAPSTPYRDGQPLCAFWMDTLCIPTRQEATNQIRYKALANMNRIYAEAAHVVVLDATLQGDIEDSGLRFASSIFTSPWMTRCWTYLEGRLAQNLLVALGGALHNPFQLFDRVARSAERFTFFAFRWDDVLQVERELAASMFKLRSLKDSNVDMRRLDNFVETWNEVLRRTTSIKSDLLIILAIMLELSIYEVEEDVVKENRLLALLKTQELLPLSFLFMAASPSYLANPYCPWAPQTISSPVNLDIGWMRRKEGIQPRRHYFELCIEESSAYVGRMKHESIGDMPTRLRMTGTGLADVVLTVNLSSDAYGCGQVSVSDVTPAQDIIIIVPQPTKAGIVHGCCLRVKQETRAWVLLEYVGAVACDIHFTLGSNEVDGDQAYPSEEPTAQTIESLGLQREIRLDHDWSLWPSLNYTRSEGNRPMTSKQGPIHVYVLVLVTLELFLASSAIVVGIVIFLGDNGSQWAAWSLALAVVLIRVLILLAIELPEINREIKMIEYQRWVASFDHAAPMGAQEAVKRSRLKLYQYHSWPLAVVIFAAACALLVVGIAVRQRLRWSLAVIGAYLLCEIVVRVTVEMIWRSPRFRGYRTRLSRWFFEDFKEGSVSLALLNPVNWFSITKMRTLLSEPNSFTHSEGQLNNVFNNPLYFNADYHRISDWYDPI